MKKRERNTRITIHSWITDHPIAFSLITLVIGALLGWIVSWILPSKPVVASNVQQKELTCTLNYSQRLIRKNTSDNKLQISYDGKPADDPYLYSISILNSGNMAISNEDFKKEFTIEFPDCGEILSAQINKASNSIVIEEVLSSSRIKDEALIISDFFLNPGEYFSVSVITNNTPSKISYNARISDISALTLRNTPKEKKDSLNTWTMVLLMFLLVAFIALIVSAYISNKRFKELMASEYQKYCNKSFGEAEDTPPY